MSNKENKFYVYEWIRLDTNEPFYIGKGSNGRWKNLTRGDNNHFNNIVKSIPCVVNILHDNLEEKVAYDLEVWYIREYRDIIGYDLCNINDGGEGNAMYGEANPFYKKGYLLSGELNPNYGNPSNYHPSEEWCRQQSERMSGENHPQYGTHCSKETKKKISNALKGKLLGINNPNAESTVCLNTMEIFDTITEASIFYNINNGGIGQCCNGNKNSCGKLADGTKLVWVYYKDFLEMTEEEIENKLKQANKKRLGKDSPSAKAVINLTTMKIFDTAKEGAEYYGVIGSNITKCCKRKADSCGQLEDGTPLVWVHYKDFLNMTEEEIQDKLRKADKRVICVTTEKIFQNIKEGADFYNCDSSSIGKCCKGRQNYCGKLEDGTLLQWMKYVDYLEQNNNNNKEVI